MMIRGRRLIKKDIVFKNPDVEFISFGHPVFEALLEWAKRNYFAKLPRGIVYHHSCLTTATYTLVFTTITLRPYTRTRILACTVFKFKLAPVRS